MHLPGPYPVKLSQKLLQDLPHLLAKPVTHSPFALQKQVMERILNYTFAEAIVDGDFEFLQGRLVQLEIQDIALCWYLTFDGRRIQIRQFGKGNARISGKLDDFLLLISQQADPDTLFFQRRLQVDGDTELGLEVKNLLDTIEPESLALPFRILHQLLQRFVQLREQKPTKPIESNI